MKLSLFKTTDGLKLEKVFFIICALWISGLFIFSKHYIEGTQVLDDWFTYKGLILYKDINEYHFPLARFIQLPIHALTNWNLTIDPFYALITALTTLFLIYLFGKRFLSSKATVISMTFFSIFFWYFATNISFFEEMLSGLLQTIIILIIFSLNRSKNITTKQTFFSGILLGSAEMMGQIVSLSIFFELLIICYFILSRPQNRKKAFKLISLLLLGTSIPALILLIYFTTNGAFYWFIYSNITHYIVAYGPEKKQALSALPLKELLTFYSSLIIYSLVLVISFFKKIRISFEYLIIFLLSLSTVPFILFSIFHYHHLSYALPILAICSGFIFDLKSPFKNIAKIAKILVLIAIIFGFISIVWPWQSNHLIYPPDFSIQNDTRPGDTGYETSEWLKKNTLPDTKILVIGNPHIYFRADRLPPVRPGKGIPYGWDPFEMVKEEILQKPAEYWIVNTGFVTRLRYGFLKPYMADFVDQELHNCYFKITAFGEWQIWKRDLTCKIII